MPHVSIRKFMHACMPCERNKLYKIHSAMGREYGAIYRCLASLWETEKGLRKKNIEKVKTKNLDLFLCSEVMTLFESVCLLLFS